MEHYTVEHILQRCPLLEHQRKGVWSVCTSIQRQLHMVNDERTDADDVPHRCGLGNSVDMRVLLQL